MSKLQLNKELHSLSKEQIIEVILEMYSLRKDAKEYFEYFLKPDVNVLYKKYEEKIFKELKRVKHYHRRELSAARITRIKNMVKDFDSFGSGKEWTVKLMFYVVECALILSSSTVYSEKYCESLAVFLKNTMTEADKNGCFSEYAGRITVLLKDDGTGFGTRALRQYYRNSLREIGIVSE